ncbi:hypothetical protein Hanom_Chr16g01473491 [Helianthus anomalus]
MRSGFGFTLSVPLLGFNPNIVAIRAITVACSRWVMIRTPEALGMASVVSALRKNSSKA